MITVLVVIIVLLLLLLGAGTVATVRRRDLDPRARTRLHRDRSLLDRPPAPPSPPQPTSSPPTPAQAPPAQAPPAPGQAGQAGTVPPAPTPGQAPPVPEQAPPAPEPAGPPLLDGSAQLDQASTHVPTEIPVAKAPRLRDRVGRARAALGAPLGSIRRKGRVDEATFDELEEALLLADVGLPTTERLLSPLRKRVLDGTIGRDPTALLDALRSDALALFHGEDRSLRTFHDATTVWLFVGVNGVGKTTTIGKLAGFERAAGRSVVLAAGDTFRAAAGDQLALWADRSGASFIRGADGADPSSVVFDAIQHASARSADLVLADTAGRLHTKQNLMDELRKLRRIADRPPGKVAEVLLVLDATTGQNGLVQARQFAEAVGVTGIVLTKLDGTAKGGVVLAIRSELALPIKLVGLGEGAQDLIEFDPDEFVNALFE